MNNNLKSLLSVKQVTVKSNINVGAGKDFECYIKAPTVSGYTPVGIIGYDLVGIGMYGLMFPHAITIVEVI